MSARKESGPAKRLRRMHEYLAADYGQQNWWPAKTSFEVVIGAYLTQNTAWRAVERSLANLEARRATTIAGLRSVDISILQEAIRPSGFQTRKAPALKAFIAMLDAEFQGSLDLLAQRPTGDIRYRLLALPSVGHETADAILLYALGHPVPIADEYLRRVVDRHRLIEPAPERSRKGYDALVKLTHAAFARDPKEKHQHLFGEFHALTVAVGKAHCRKTPRCTGCPLAPDLDQL